jgi:aspartokinase
MRIKSILVITGFIGSNDKHETTTLGRNGSNYTASLANYINAEELQNFTHVDGIYTANPELVLDAKRLNPCLIAKQMKWLILEQILNAKTIIPLLEKNSTRILNTFNHENNGTLILQINASGIKTLSVLENVSLVNLEGRGFTR